MPVAPTAPAVPSALRAFNRQAARAEPAVPGDADVLGPELPAAEEDAAAPPPASEPPPAPAAGQPAAPDLPLGDAAGQPSPGDAAPQPPAPRPAWAGRPPEPPPADAPQDALRTGRAPAEPRPRVDPAALLPGLRARPRLLLLVAAAVVLVVVVVAIRGSSGITTLVAQQQTDTAIAQARARAAGGDPQGAVRSLESLRPAATADERTLLRDAEAGILVDAARAAGSKRDAFTALSLIRQASGFADTPEGQDALAALPQALVDAARQLLAAPPSDASAANLLRQAIAAAPGSPAATLAAQLLAQPVSVSGRLTVRAVPGAGLAAALFALATVPGQPPRPAAASPVASATCAANGSFDLGVVPPGSYLFAYVDPAHHAHLGPVVSVEPAQRNLLVEALPA